MKIAKTKSKMAMVRDALNQLTNEAKPPEIAAYIKKTYGVEFERLANVSGYKCKILSGFSKKDRKVKQVPVEIVGPSTANNDSCWEGTKPAKTAPSSTNHSFGWDDIQATKDLIQRYGADQVLEIVALMA